MANRFPAGRVLSQQVDIFFRIFLQNKKLSEIVSDSNRPHVKSIQLIAGFRVTDCRAGEPDTCEIALTSFNLLTYILSFLISYSWSIGGVYCMTCKYYQREGRWKERIPRTQFLSDYYLIIKVAKKALNRFCITVVYLGKIGVNKSFFNFFQRKTQWMVLRNNGLRCEKYVLSIF